MKPAAPSMRHAPTDAPRRELSKSVEFLKIGSLHQMLWLRDLDRVYRVHCDSTIPGLYTLYVPCAPRQRVSRPGNDTPG